MKLKYNMSLAHVLQIQPLDLVFHNERMWNSENIPPTNFYHLEVGLIFPNVPNFPTSPMSTNFPPYLTILMGHTS
eukprot:UN16515